MDKHVGVKTLLAVTLIMLLVVTGGCKGKGQQPVDTGVSDGMVPADGNGEALSDIEQERLLFGESGLQKVYFDYDSYSIRSDVMGILNTNAELIKQAPNVIIQIAGHCDERGTQEYNLALGEKRALAVRSYLMTLGVPGNRLVSISYGEEMPAVTGSDESAWKFNRRCEFNKAVAN